MSDCPVIVTAPGAQFGPTPQTVPVPETSAPSVLRERLMREPAGLALNCHSHWPARVPRKGRVGWLQPAAKRSGIEASEAVRSHDSFMRWSGARPRRGGPRWTGTQDKGKEEQDRSF
jgi:hypothetical protein